MVGTDRFTVSTQEVVPKSSDRQPAQEEQQLTGSIRDLIKIKRHFYNVLILIYLWIASSFNIYLAQYIIKYLPGDFFVNATTTNSADLPIIILGGVAY